MSRRHSVALSPSIASMLRRTHFFPFTKNARLFAFFNMFLLWVPGEKISTGNSLMEGHETSRNRLFLANVWQLRRLISQTTRRSMKSLKTIEMMRDWRSQWVDFFSTRVVHFHWLWQMVSFVSFAAIFCVSAFDRSNAHFSFFQKHIPPIFRNETKHTHKTRLKWAYILNNGKWETFYSKRISKRRFKQQSEMMEKEQTNCCCIFFSCCTTMKAGDNEESVHSTHIFCCCVFFFAVCEKHSLLC